MEAGQRAILQRTLENIVGTSPWIRQIRHDAVRVAAHSANALITGPTGTGKELIARAIHVHSERANHPFIPVDVRIVCEALPSLVWDRRGGTGYRMSNKE